MGQRPLIWQRNSFDGGTSGKVVMSRYQYSAGDWRGLARASEVERLQDELEAAWKKGGRPRLETFLADADESVQADLLGALLPIELEGRRRAGEIPREIE